VLVLIFARDAAFQFRHDAIASLFYVTNWWYVVQDLSYFEAMGRPPVLQHLWSLAVEEQFYLLWPLALVFLYRWRGRPGVGRVALIGRAVQHLLMAIGSFVWNLPASGDASRLYFGTDTHCMGLLLGAALATVWRPGPCRGTSRLPAKVVLWAVAGGAVVRAVRHLPQRRRDERMAVPRRLHGRQRGHRGDHRPGHAPGDRLRKLLAVQPMRYIGERSYGLYLYHWPIFVVTDPASTCPSTACRRGSCGWV
jgi:peptidoglycan/LPS O-acetylase OafA/YrhL